jgi:WD40 repeat protein
MTAPKRRRSWPTVLALTLACVVVVIAVLFLARPLLFLTARPAPAPWRETPTYALSNPPMAFSADSAWFYSVTLDQLVSLDLRTGAEQRAPLTDRRSSLALTTGSKLFRVGESTPEDVLRIKNYLSVATVNGGAIGEWKELDPELSSRNDPLFLSASPAGETVALVSNHQERGEGGITRGGQKLETFSAHKPSERRLLITHLTHFPYPPKFSADGTALIWTDAGYSLSVWRASDGHRLLNLPNTVSDGYALSPDGSRVAWQRGAKCCVWSVEGGHELDSWPIPGAVSGIEFHPDGTVVAACTIKTGPFRMYGVLQIRNAATGRVQTLRVHDDGPIEAVMISPDGRFLATCGGRIGNPSVRLWRWEQLAP